MKPEVEQMLERTITSRNHVAHATGNAATLVSVQGWWWWTSLSSLPDKATD